MLLRDNRYAPHFSTAFVSHPFFTPDSRHPEGRSCTQFRRTISAYLKSIRDSVRCTQPARMYVRVYTCGLGRHVCRNWPELHRSQRQYIIEIYKFSSTPARKEVGMLWWRWWRRCSFKTAREGRATTISAVLTGEIFKRPSLILPPSRVERRPYSTLRASRVLLDPYLASITRTVHAK